MFLSCIYVWHSSLCVHCHWWHTLIAQCKSCSFNDAAQKELQEKKKKGILLNYAHFKESRCFPLSKYHPRSRKKIALKVICLLRTRIVFKHCEHYTFIVTFCHNVAFYTTVSEPRIGEMWELAPDLLSEHSLGLGGRRRGVGLQIRNIMAIILPNTASCGRRKSWKKNALASTSPSSSAAALPLGVGGGGWVGYCVAKRLMKMHVHKTLWERCRSNYN